MPGLLLLAACFSVGEWGENVRLSAQKTRGQGDGTVFIHGFFHGFAFYEWNFINKQTNKRKT